MLYATGSIRICALHSLTRNRVTLGPVVSVISVTRVLVGRAKNLGLIPGRLTISSLLKNAQTGPGPYPTSSSECRGGADYSGKSWPEPEVVKSSLSNDNVRNVWISASTSPIHLYGLHKEDSTLTLSDNHKLVISYYRGQYT